MFTWSKKPFTPLQAVGSNGLVKSSTGGCEVPELLLDEELEDSPELLELSLEPLLEELLLELDSVPLELELELEELSSPLLLDELELELEESPELLEELLLLELELLDGGGVGSAT